jgi:hypothetical protein
MGRVIDNEMSLFIYRENLKRLRALLTRTADPAECQRIVDMIEGEGAIARAQSN